MSKKLYVNRPANKILDKKVFKDYFWDYKECEEVKYLIENYSKKSTNWVSMSRLRNVPTLIEEYETSIVNN